MRKQQSQADQSNSDVHSSRKSRRSRRFRSRIMDGGDSSKMDSVSNISGFMSRTTKKRSFKKGAKTRTTSLAMQNELIINKLQEQLVELKNKMNTDVQRIDASI